MKKAYVMPLAEIVAYSNESSILAGSRYPSGDISDGTEIGYGGNAGSDSEKDKTGDAKGSNTSKWDWDD